MVILANGRSTLHLQPDGGKNLILGVDAGQEAFMGTDALARHGADQSGSVYVAVNVRGLGDALHPHLPGQRRIKPSDMPLTAAGLAMSYARLAGAKEVVLPSDYNHLAPGLQNVADSITERADINRPLKVVCAKDGGRTGRLYDLRQGEPRGSLVFLSGGPDSQMVLDQTTRSNVQRGEPTTTVHIDFGQPAQNGEQKGVDKIVATLSQQLGDTGYGSLFRHIDISIPHIQKAFAGMGEFGYAILRNIIEASYFMGLDIARILRAKEVVHANLLEDVVDLPWLKDFFNGLDAFAKEKRKGAVASPVIDTPKATLFAMADDLLVDLGTSHSCLKGGEEHCGACRACIRRQQAFQGAEVPDTTKYLT